jgi:hypothetical protein
MTTPDPAYSNPATQRTAVPASGAAGSSAGMGRPAGPSAGPAQGSPPGPGGIARGQAPVAPDRTHMPGSPGPTAPRGPAMRPGGPRMVRLTLGRLDPWSVMKLGFLLSVAIGISFVVLVAVLWIILQAMGVFTDIDRTIGTVLGTASGSEFDLMDYVGFGRVLSLAIVIAVIDVFLLTAIATLGAFLYNISASLVGGVQTTLTDD